MDNYKTLVFGATTKPNRYAYLAAESLQESGVPYELVGRSSGSFKNKAILPLSDFPEFDNIHTITLYMNPDSQKMYYSYIVSLQPKRVIFNPGTENLELMQLLAQKGIASEQACTLVLLSSGQYMQ